MTGALFLGTACRFECQILQNQTADHYPDQVAQMMIGFLGRLVQPMLYLRPEQGADRIKSETETSCSLDTDHTGRSWLNKAIENLLPGFAIAPVMTSQGK
jgi:hypothetical protein